MVLICEQLSMPTPVMATSTDDNLVVFDFAIDAFCQGHVALATLVAIRGGAARALGSHMAIASDGRYCGYISGGCVEAAVASEALLAMAEGRDRQLVYGEGSPFFDIVLPCGGGITVAVHLLRNTESLKSVLTGVNRRQPIGMCYSPSAQSLSIIDAPKRTEWSNDDFLTAYTPPTQIYVSGHSVEAHALIRIAQAAGYSITAIEAHDKTAAFGIDRFSAVVLLHHDLEAEASVLEAALRSEAFYVGALGSTRTHRNRVMRLQHQGIRQSDIERIKAPIGMFGPTKESTSLALSVLADIAAAQIADGLNF